MQNKSLSWEEFLNEYEPLYFITSQNILIRNKTSLFVEKEIERILIKGLSPNDLPFILAWKIGTINQKASIRDCRRREI